MNNLKKLIILECERVIELIKEDQLFAEKWWGRNPNRAELKNKMKELRRDMMRLEKMLYGKNN